MTLPGSLNMTYAYNAKGQLIGMTDWDGQYTQMLYDNVGRRVATIRQNGLSSRSEYDAGGRLFRLTHHERNKVLARFIFKLDRRGNKTQAAEQLARPASTVQTIGIADGAVSYYKGTWNTVGSYKVTTQFSSAMTITITGNEATLTMGTGTDHGIYDIYIDGSLWESFDGYTTSGIDRLINIYLDKGGSHTIDIQNRAEKNKNSSGYSLRFKQLVVLSTIYDIQTIDYTYDALARLLTGSYSGLTPTRNYTYAYDRSGNRIQQVVNIGGSPTTTNYGYNAANQLISDGVHTLTYDNNGNLRSDGTNTHTWNRANRLTALGSTSYVYDGEGHRVQQTVGASVTKYLLDLQPGLAVVLSETTGANVMRYVHGAMGIQARKDPTGNWFWSLQDALGSVRSEVSNAVAVQGTRHFDPIGNGYGLQGSFSGMSYEFTGEPKDSDGLLYLRERYLNTQLGIFTGIDPFEGSAQVPMSLNRYMYVKGNSINNTDPSGLCEPQLISSVYSTVDTIKTGLGLHSVNGRIPTVGATVACAAADAHSFLIEHGQEITDTFEIAGATYQATSFAAAALGVSAIAVVITGAAIVGAIGLILYLAEHYPAQPYPAELLEAMRPPTPGPQQVPTGTPGPQTQTSPVPTATTAPLAQPQLEPVPMPPNTDCQGSKHVFYFAQTAPYMIPGRNTPDIVADLGRYTSIQGISGEIGQLNQGQGFYDSVGGGTIYILMGRKFEAERAIYFAGRNALVEAHASGAGYDLIPRNFGTIQYIQVKWSNTPMPKYTQDAVIAEAKTHASGTYLVESNNLDLNATAELLLQGGKPVPFPYP